MRAPILSTLLLSSVVTLGIAHIGATEFLLYWKYLWLDYATHMLGGICVALSYLLVASYLPRLPKRYFDLIGTLAFVLTIGLLWEIFEMYAGLWGIEMNLMEDTMIDLGMDLVGGILGYIVGSRFRSE